MMLENFKIHHIGVATKDIEKEFKTFSMLGYGKVSETFEDKTQKIKGVFIEAKNQPRLELLENLAEDGSLKSHILKGNKFYHIAYQVENIEQVSEELIKSARAKIICPIVGAVYFKKICFVLMPNMMIVELVQLKEVS